MPEELTYQAKLRKVMVEAITEEDVKEVVAGIVSRAKKGDRIATKQLFDHLLGGNRPVTAIQVNNYGDGDPGPESLETAIHDLISNRGPLSIRQIAAVLRIGHDEVKQAVGRSEWFRYDGDVVSIAISG